MFCCCILAQNTLTAQIDTTCSINAGMDFGICADVSSFQLEGSYNGMVDLSTLMWDGPSGFDINTPTQLTTEVTPSGAQFPEGVFEFYLGAECDGTYYEDTVVLTVTDLEVPVISWNGIPEDGPISVCREVHLSATLAGPNQDAFWNTVDPFNANVFTFLPNDNNDSLYIRFNATWADCDDSLNVIYVLDEEGCRRSDTLTVHFVAAPLDQGIQFPKDSTAYCGDTLLVFSNGFGCMGFGTWNWLNTPNGIEPDLLLEEEDGRLMTYDFVPSGTGWYTLEFTSNAMAPCTTNVDTHDFYLCVTDLTFGNTFTTYFYCDSLPLCGPLVNTNGAIDAGCPATAWSTDDPMITISGNTWCRPSGYTPTHLSFTQTMQCQECELPDGETVTCFPVHTHRVNAGPVVTVDADTILLSCGGDVQFEPFDYVTTSFLFQSWKQVCWLSGPSGVPPPPELCGGTGQFYDLSEEGVYEFRIIVSSTNADNGVICRDTAFMTVLVQTLDKPCAGVVSTLTCKIPAQLDGCTPNGPADILWRQLDSNAPLVFDPSDDVEDPFITACEPGTYQLEYSFSRSPDCYLADTLTFDVVCDTCDITPRAWLDWIRCRYDEECAEVYDFQLAVFDPGQCHTVDEIITNVGDVVVNGIFHIGNTLFINGTLFGAGPGELVCAEISFINTLKDCPVFCDVEICFETPRCVCRVDNLVTSNIPKCIKPQKSYCLEVEFDYCGPEGPMDFISGFGTSDGIIIANYFNQATGDNTVTEGNNVWTLCFSFFGPCADELIFEYIGEMENAKCSIRDEVRLSCCCDEKKWVFTDIECFTSHGEQGYSYVLVIDDAADCGGFSLTTNGDEPSFYGWNYVDGDLVINGSVFGLSSPGSLCVDIDFENEDCCDITACTKLPCCCQVAPVVNVLDIQCVQDEAGNISYDFTIEVGNPNGWAEDYDLTVSCGDVTSTWIPEGNKIIVSGSITNLTAEPGDECCFDFDFANCNLCDVRKCVELPPCECVEDITVVYPDCVEPGVPFCVTYNFNYYGPPTSGVYSWWYIATASSDPGWTMTSPGDMEDVPISFGANSVEVCLVYEGECLEDGINLVVRGDMFTEETGLCCQIRDEQKLKCCCACELDIVYCFDHEELSSYIKDILSRKSRTQEDDRLKEWARKYQERKSPCEGEKDCCPICQAPDYQGLIRVELDCPGGVPDGIQYLWNTGATGNQIIGSYPGTYSVTVTDPINDCEYIVEEEIICDEVEGKRIQSNPQGQNEIRSKSIDSHMYLRPNPANNQVWVQSPELLGNYFVLIDQFGQVVFSKYNVDAEVLDVDVSSIPEGIYYGVIRNSNGQELIAKRLVIMH